MSSDCTRLKEVEEIDEKLSRIRSFMDEMGYEGVVLSGNDNFSWISAGKSAFVDTTTGEAVGKIYITPKKQYVICSSSEMFRLMEEELNEGRFELVSYKWYEREEDILRKLFGGARVASDNYIYSTDNQKLALQKLRYKLTENEIERYSKIGIETAEIVEQCCREIIVGDGENDIAALVMGKFAKAGYRLPVCLVATDERLLRYRHPIPKLNKLKKYAMISICAQKYGLVVSISRLVCFGSLDKEIANKYKALLEIDATYILNTVAGTSAGRIIKKGHRKYEKSGYGEEFHLHHQGGAIGYLTRDYCANELSSETVCLNQAFSWNPTISGTKLEDTYIINNGKPKIISQTNNWPLVNVTIKEGNIKRPLILLR